MADKTKANEIQEEPKKAAQQEEPTARVSVEQFVQKYRQPLLIGGGVLAALVLGLIGYRLWKGSQNTQAQAEMYQAVYYFEADSMQKALDGDGQYPGFLEVSESYGGTDAANLANYYIGVIYLKQEKYQEAAEYLEKFSHGDHLLSMAAHRALGAAYEGQGELEKAASLYERAARTPAETEALTPYLLMQAANAYEAAGNTSRALSLYREIRKSFPLSDEANEVEKYIGRLSDEP
ncbi:MAG: tetratricopeptide repeat protein [Bacteroidia bacterium]|nr:tetratricopeptide repeat protein [Bacteroidia bacterium]